MLLTAATRAWLRMPRLKRCDGSTAIEVDAAARLHNRPQLLTRTLDSTLHPRHRHAGPACGLGLGDALEVGHPERLLIGRRQLTHHRQHTGGKLAKRRSRVVVPRYGARGLVRGREIDGVAARTFPPNGRRAVVV